MDGVIGAKTGEAAVANRRHPAQIGHLTLHGKLLPALLHFSSL